MLAPNFLSEIERRALEISTELDRKHGPWVAEILPAVTPRWHMVNAQPGKEAKAAKFLSDKQFGVFVPKFDDGSMLELKVKSPSGREAIEMVSVGGKLIFPGRVFIFVWDVLAHWRRIRECPAVQSVFLDGTHNPLVIPDIEINKIQVLQFSLLPKEKKKRKRYGVGSEGHFRSEFTRSFWTVDGDQRNRALDRSLGLAS